jgi:hypothetical protein
MLTRTALRASAIEVLRTNQRESRRLLDDLGEYGILMIPPGFLRSAPEVFPESVWIRLTELIKEGEIAHRTTDPSFIESVAVAPPWQRHDRIEVILDEDQERAPISVDCLPVSSYSGAFHLERCRKLRNKSEQCSSRDELWEWVFEPLLDGLFKSRRKITICDNYLAKHIQNIDLGKDPTWHGLTWMLSRIQDNSAMQDLGTTVRLVCRERNDNDTQISTLSLQGKMEEIVRHLGLDLLEIEVTVVSDRVLDRRPDLKSAFHDRFILFGRRRAITLGSGMDNLTKRKGDMSQQTLARAWNYASDYGLLVADLLHELQHNTPTSHQFRIERLLGSNG